MIKPGALRQPGKGLPDSVIAESVFAPPASAGLFYPKSSLSQIIVDQLAGKAARTRSKCASSALQDAGTLSFTQEANSQLTSRSISA